MSIKLKTHAHFAAEELELFSLACILQRKYKGMYDCRFLRMAELMELQGLSELDAIIEAHSTNDRVLNEVLNHYHKERQRATHEKTSEEPRPSTSRVYRKEAWWRVLNVDAEADAKTVKASYRQMSKAAHPDTGGSADSFRRIQEAWEMYQREQKAGS